jgi:hypothetical protein
VSFFVAFWHNLWYIKRQDIFYNKDSPEGFVLSGDFFYYAKCLVVRKTLRLPANAPATGKIKLEFAAASDKSVIAPGEHLPGYYPLVRQLKKNSFNKANFQISEIEIWSK